MHNKVVYHAAKAFSYFGLPTLRFNFRGTGLSEGAHDDGRGEVDDGRAALDWLTARFDLPILFAGFSFGSNVGLRACCGDARVRGLVGLGLPVRAAGRDYRYDFLPACGSVPKLFISGDHDEFQPTRHTRGLPSISGVTTARDPLHRRRRSLLRRHSGLARTQAGAYIRRHARMACRTLWPHATCLNSTANSRSTAERWPRLSRNLALTVQWETFQ